jgi:hypothetical protein
LINGSSALKSGVPATPSHSNRTISALTISRLLPAIDDGAARLERCRVLLEGARRLAVPILAAEQYPQGLGPTVPTLAELVPRGRIYPKRHRPASAPRSRPRSASSTRSLPAS